MRRSILMMATVVAMLMAMAAVAGAEPRGGIDPIKPTNVGRPIVPPIVTD